MSTLILATTDEAASGLSAVAGTEAPAPGRAPTLFSLFRRYRGRILAAYALLNLENLLSLAQPYCLGRAINGLLHGTGAGLCLFVGQYIGHLAVGVARRVYDARAFNRIYSDIVASTVVHQRSSGANVSRISARSALSRAYAEFYQQHLPVILQAAYSIGGSLLVLGLYDRWLIALCLSLLAPLVLLGWAYRRWTTPLNMGLHDELENEVDVIQAGSPGEVEGHYARVARWRIRLVDSEALNFAAMDAFVLVLIAVSLLRSCHMRSADAGDIFAVFRYVMMFVSGLDAIPFLIQQVVRLQDIGRRLREFDEPGVASGCEARGEKR